MTDIEQDLLIELMSLNRGHLSPEYQITEAAFDDRCEVGFILPIGGLNVKDIVRLSKPKGCLLCGEETHSTCSACLSAQYCGKGEIDSIVHSSFSSLTSVSLSERRLEKPQIPMQSDLFR
jgi:hypothetical protein